MPIPTPNKGETKQDFIGRCMGDDVMVKDFPDVSQRAGVCYSQWDKEGMNNESLLLKHAMCHAFMKGDVKIPEEISKETIQEMHDRIVKNMEKAGYTHTHGEVE